MSLDENTTSSNDLGKKNEPKSSWLKGMLLAIPVLFAITWSTYPALKTWFAVQRFKRSTIVKIFHEDRPLSDNLSRQVQKFFLKYGVYIPTDDIIIQNKSGQLDKLILFHMRKSCDQGKLYIWIPFKVRIPLFGEKVIESCFKQP